MNTCKLTYISDQPSVCERCRPRDCHECDGDAGACFVYQALVDLDTLACKTSSAMTTVRHLTRPALNALADYTGDGFANAADEYGAEFDAALFRSHCGARGAAVRS